jgi:hypothetical protein
VAISFADGGKFSGDVKRGVIEGVGEMKTVDGF